MEGKTMLKKTMSIVAGAVLSVTVSANVQAATITVKKGDTLWDLSRANNTTVENIQMLNNLTTDLIHPGDVLTIAPEKQYTVKKGDTLWDIAQEHDVTVAQLKEWNELSSDLIHPGLNLIIFEGAKTTNTVKTEKKVTPTAQETKNAPTATATPSTNQATTKSEPAAAAPSTTTEGKKKLIMEATAYTASCEGCSGITATGIDLRANPDLKVISVDPSVIPLGSKVYVEGYGEAIAGDTGGAIKGNKIDVFIPSKEEAIQFGRKQVEVTILN
jgi:3D (Asp-Asp-Asp) domain-containing protein/LysM repeat protein